MSSEPSVRDESAAGSESPDDQGDALPSKNPPDAKPSKPETPSALSSTQSPSPQDLPQDLPQGPTVPQEAAPPPLPLEKPPPLDDDGWDPIWDPAAQAFYFYNRFTNITQWDNPRVPSDTLAVAPGVGNYDRIPSTVTEDPSVAQQAPPPRPYGGYDPAIHGDYDPTAPYAQEAAAQIGGDDSLAAAGLGAPSAMVAGDADPATIYTATGAFNRFTGKWQASTISPENHNDENKSKRQMSAFFDVDAAANSHNGKSLKAERSGKKLTKQELKAFKEKRKEKKEERRRAWLRD